MGGASTACNPDTKSVLVECAHTLIQNQLLESLLNII